MTDSFFNFSRENSPVTLFYQPLTQGNSHFILIHLVCVTKLFLLSGIQASKGLFASTVMFFSYQELQQESESDVSWTNH